MKVFLLSFALIATIGVAIASDHDDYGPKRGPPYGEPYGGGPYGGGPYGGGPYRRGPYRGGSPHAGGRYGPYKRVLCPKLPDPANGDVNVTGRYPGQKAIYSCDKGFQLVGFATRSCSRNGKWSGEAPICKRIDCGPLPHIANGQVSTAPDTRLGSTATYICISGYNLVGKDTRTCEAEGWSGQEPVCEPVDCGDLEDPKNGWVHIAPDTLLGAVALYRCKLGYQLSSDDERTCQTNGHWSGTAPTCQPISCGPQPKPRPNSKISATQGTSLRDQTIYDCNPGYYLEGTKTIYCQHNGQYSDKAPECKRIDCGDLPCIANGDVNIKPDTKLGSSATYSCDAGFILQGNVKRTCLANGKWSGTQPSCAPVMCGNLPNPPNGWVHIAPNFLLGAVAIYRCKLGYQLTPASSERRYCQTNGHWSGSAPTCNPISCGPQPAPDPNGKIQSTQGTSLGDKTTYSCNTGFYLVGTATIYCQNDKSYSDEAPKCQPVNCGAPDPADPNGSLHFTTTTFQSRAVYSCNAGYILSGHAVSVCKANGEWSREAPTCEPVDCGDLPAPKNGGVTFYPGTTLASTATFRCKKGFRLVGSEVRTCGVNGKWSGVQPVCKKIQCPKLRPPKHGKIFVSGQYPGDYAIYRCAYGYSASSKSRRVCLHSGKWSGSPIQCNKDHYDDGYYGGYGKDHEY